MDIRTLKKQVFYVIAEAMNHVNLDPSEGCRIQDRLFADPV